MEDKVRINLSKKVARAIPKDIVITLALDVSESNRENFTNGNIKRLLQRILGITNVVNDEGILNFYLFDSKAHIQKPLIASVAYDQVPQIVNEIYSNNSYWTGTSFEPVLDKITKDLIQPNQSFLNKLLGKKQPNAPKNLILVITDGDNTDQEETSHVLFEMKHSPNTYIQFLDVGNNNQYLIDLAANESFIGYSHIDTFEIDDNSFIDALVSKSLLKHFGY